jgi:uncharacterized protein YjiS (DUF1127 family)
MTHGAALGSVPAITTVAGSPAKRAVARLWRFIEAALRVRRERRELGALDDYLLKDIGVSRSQAQREANRDFFDVPEHRIRRL